MTGSDVLVELEADFHLLKVGSLLAEEDGGRIQL